VRYVPLGRSVPPSLITRWGWSIGTRSGSPTARGRQIIRIRPPPGPRSQEVIARDFTDVQRQKRADGPRERDAALCTRPSGGGVARQRPAGRSWRLSMRAPVVAPARCGDMPALSVLMNAVLGAAATPSTSRVHKAAVTFSRTICPFSAAGTSVKSRAITSCDWGPGGGPYADNSDDHVQFGDSRPSADAPPPTGLSMKVHQTCQWTYAHFHRMVLIHGIGPPKPQLCIRQKVPKLPEARGVRGLRRPSECPNKWPTRRSKAALSSPQLWFSVAPAFPGHGPASLGPCDISRLRRQPRQRPGPR